MTKETEITNEAGSSGSALNDGLGKKLYLWLAEYKTETQTYHIANSVGLRGKTRVVLAEMKKLAANGLVAGRKGLDGAWHWKVPN